MPGRKEGNRCIRISSLQALPMKTPCELVKCRQIVIGNPQAIQRGQDFSKLSKLRPGNSTREDFVADDVGDDDETIPNPFPQVFKDNG